MSASRRFLAWAIVASIGVVGLISGCGSGDGPAPPQASINGSPAGSDAEGESTAQVLQPVELTADSPRTESPRLQSSGTESAGAEFPRTDSSAPPQAELHPEVLITTSLGAIRVRLDAEHAPQTVDNFLANYVDRGFYEQTVFHYVDQGFMVAAGGFTPAYEPKETRTPVFNESNNGLSNRRGTIAMARHPEHVHSATSQFFFNLVDNPALDHQDNDEGLPNGYCVFGEVVAGMDVLDKIAAVEVTDREGFPKTPTQAIVIESIQRVAQ